MDIKFQVLQKEIFDAAYHGEVARSLLPLGGSCDNGDDYGLGVWECRFNVLVTNQDGETKSFTVSFQPRERNDALCAYDGDEISFAHYYGCDSDESVSLSEFCEDDESVNFALWDIAQIEATKELCRLLDMLKKGELQIDDPRI